VTFFFSLEGARLVEMDAVVAAVREAEKKMITLRFS
jgi:hypothetical protein